MDICPLVEGFRIVPRPTKWRRVAFIPDITYFKPAGIPLRFLEEVALSFEELEAIRLKDLEGLEQEDCAQKMEISRPTFHRVLNSGRRKLAEALVQGKAIRVEGGSYQLAFRRFECAQGHAWELPLEQEASDDSSATCPRCGIPGLAAAPFGRGWRHGRGGGWRGGGP